MYKKTAIILCLFSMIFAQDNVELEENRHFNSYQINLDRFKQLNEDITTPNTYPVSYTHLTLPTTPYV